MRNASHERANYAQDDVADNPVAAALDQNAREPASNEAGWRATDYVPLPTQPNPTREPYSSALADRLAACGLSASEIISIDSLTAQKRMVEAGFGLALLPSSSVDEELRSGTLCVLRVTAMRTTIPVVLIHRRRAFQSGATQALKTLLTAWPKP